MLRRILLLLLLLVPFAVYAQDTTEVEQAQHVVQMLAEREYEDVYALFTDDVKAVFTLAQLQQAWEQITASFGEYQSIVSTNADAVSHRVALVVQFEKFQLEARIAFDAEGKMTALNFVPVSEPTQPAPTPVYAEPDNFTETEVTVGTYNLPGTLTIPNGMGEFPTVLLISGSGPNDRDETIGRNKPFRDLAWGLAAQGIATLRYDKSTLVALDQFARMNFTLKEEYIDDALAALALLRQTEGIDPDNIFILGHSLGGYVAPRIAAADPDIAGVIIASGLALPLPETILRQTRYLASLVPDSQSAQEAIPVVEGFVEQINALTPDSLPDEFLLGAPPAYWLDVRDYDPAALAATLPQPILVLQGERDYQVTVADDLPRWQSELADHADTTFEVYPDLNHIYVTGEGMATSDEYDQPGNVAQEVIDDIAAWVKAH
jgi:dienelactone hydrolase